MKYILGIIIFCTFTGCNSFKQVKNKLSGGSPYEQYAKALENAGLAKTEIAGAWKNAGNRVFSDSIMTGIPFTETGYFAASSPEARSYRFHVKAGQVLIVKGTVKIKSEGKVFIDLFVKKDNKWKQVEFADTSLSIKYEFEEEYDCLLRVQPELLVNVFFTITLTSTPVLINPVFGATNKSIGSFYGDERDAGGRKHEGVDIFAPRGTPVIAPVSGYVSSVGNSKLGGKVVWMYDGKRGISYYFAHLDTQLVSIGKVNQGDTLGTVGNTGNAKYTPAHLHFGIYQRGSKDPLNYIKRMEELVETNPEDTSFSPQPYKVSAKKASLYVGPGKAYKNSMNLMNNEYIQVLGYNKNWFRVRIANNMEGYVARKELSPATKGIKIKLPKETHLLTEANNTSVPIGNLKANSKVEILSENEDFKYVKDTLGRMGWIGIVE